MWQTYRRLRQQGVLSINQRNSDFVLRYNPRHLYPLVDDKLKTKRLALQAGIAVPPLYQLIEMTAFRAIENRIPILRAANTGVTATIDKFGRIRKKTDTFKEDILVDEIYLGNEKTFYTKYPDLFIYLLFISFIGIIIIKRKHGAL